MLSCYRTFVKQQNSTLLLQRSYRCHLARLELKLLKAQARDLHAVGEERNILRQENALMKAEIEALKNQIESDKAAHIVEELHKNIKDNEDELEQVKKTHVKTVHELQTAEALVDELKLEICKANEENDALEKTVEMSKDTYESELSALKRDLEKLREDKIRFDVVNTKLLQDNSKYEAEIQVLKRELGETRSSLEEMKSSNSTKNAIFTAATVGKISRAGEIGANNSNSRSRKMGRQSSLDIMKEISLQKDLEEARNEVECLRARLRSQGDIEDESKGSSDKSDVYRLQEELSKVKAELQLAISQKDAAESDAALTAVLEETAASEDIDLSKYRALEKANSELTAELDSCRAELQEVLRKSQVSSVDVGKKTSTIELMTRVKMQKELDEAHSTISELRSLADIQNSSSENEKETAYSYRANLVEANKEIQRLQKLLDGRSNDEIVVNGDLTTQSNELQSKLDRKIDEIATLSTMLDDANAQVAFERNRWRKTQRTNVIIMEEVDNLSATTVKLNRLLKAEIVKTRKLKEKLTAAGSSTSLVDRHQEISANGNDLGNDSFSSTNISDRWQSLMKSLRSTKSLDETQY
mmetsp:Transcript_21883/g.28198  ORF Transcript_21883/g.28198 Transcript_21883/m.28198 type:complete len:587 (+) Transcript_21883:500-2260(+)